MRYTLIITKFEDAEEEKKYGHYGDRTPPTSLNVEVTEKQFEAIRKAVLEHF